MSCSYMITLSPDATDADLQAVKDQIVKNGGTIDHENTLIKGLTVTMPEVHSASFATHPKVAHVEKDQTVTTQVA